jgi:hypothetical protein
MELASIQHIEPEQLPDYQADLFIASVSNDSRCVVVAKGLKELDCKKLALYGPAQGKQQELIHNKALFEELGFQAVEVTTEVPAISGLLEGLQQEVIRLIFDGSSMSQNWYYEFFRWFSESQDRYQKVYLRFVYSMGAYVPDYAPLKVKGVREFLKTGDRKQKRKKALILGLGHEAHVAEAIVKLEKPDLLYLFYSDPAVDKRFVEQVFINNHGLINDTPIRNLVSYPIHNGQSIYQSLIDILLPIRDEYSITLVPQGPKIFSVAAMLVHLGYPDTLISYPVFKKTHSSDRIPCGEPVVLDICFEADE